MQDRTALPYSFTSVVSQCDASRLVDNEASIVPSLIRLGVPMKPHEAKTCPVTITGVIIVFTRTKFWPLPSAW